MESIEFVFESGAKPVDDVADYAAGWEKLEVLQFLHSKGYVSTPHGMTVAAEAGALDIVKMFMTCLDTPILPRAVDGAIINRQKEVALFLYSQGGGCSAGLFRYASAQGRTDILELLSEVKQPLPQQSTKSSRKNRRQERDYPLTLTIPLSPLPSPPTPPSPSRCPPLSPRPLKIQHVEDSETRCVIQ